MKNRERFRAAMAFEEVDLPCHVEHGFWDETYDRWSKEGLPEKVAMPKLFSLSRGEDLFSYFNILKMGYIRPNVYLYPGMEHLVLEETDEFRIERNANGVVVKTSKTSISLPQYMDYSIKSRSDYYSFKEQLTGDFEARYPADWDKTAIELRNQDQALVCTHMDGFFAYPRELMGVECMLLMFYDDPEFMREMINDRVDFYMRLYERAIKDTSPDFAFIWEDMCFKNGPLVSPGIFEEFMLPAYKKITSFLRDMGIRNIIVDSDGDVIKLLPLWLKGGVTGLLPFEVKAGMDIVKIAEEFPTLQIFGGIDKHEIAKGPAEIDAELARVMPAMMKRGGYCVTLDHWVPPDISLFDFRYYTEKIRNYFS